MSTLIATKVKDAEIWLPRFINEVESLEGDVEKIVVMYGDCPDKSYSYLLRWQETSKHTIEIYHDPYIPPDERHGAMLARVKQDIQKILEKSTADYYLNLDCDLVQIQRDCIPRLIEQDKDLIAGMVWTEGRLKPTFFDTYIFRKDGARFHPLLPPGLFKEEPFMVDSVSTFYLAKREVELAGEYSNPYPHLPFCSDLRNKGYGVWVHPQVHSVHVDLEKLGIMHQPLPVQASMSPYVDCYSMTYSPQQMGAIVHDAKVNEYAYVTASLEDEGFLKSYAKTREWLNRRPLLTACYKYYDEAELLPLSIASIYEYVDRILIASGSVKLREKQSKPDITEELDYDHKVKVIHRDQWDSKEQIQGELLKNTVSKWMLYVDADEIIEGMNLLRGWAVNNPDKIYARPETFLNYVGDLHHIAYSLNPQSPWYRFGVPHDFLINRDIAGLNFGFHTRAMDGFGKPLYGDFPVDRDRKAVLDGVKVHHLGNALDKERIESKLKYYTLRGDAKVYESQILEGKYESDMVVERYGEKQPKLLENHPLHGKELIKVVKTKPNYEVEWLE